MKNLKAAFTNFCTRSTQDTGYQEQGAGSLALLIVSWLQLDLQEQQFSWKSAIYIMERRSPSLLITQLQKQVLEIKPLGHPTTATATGTDSRNTSTLSLATPGIFLLGTIFKEGTRPNYIFRSEPHRIVLPFSFSQRTRVKGDGAHSVSRGCHASEHHSDRVKPIAALGHPPPVPSGEYAECQHHQ